MKVCLKQAKNAEGKTTQKILGKTLKNLKLLETRALRVDQPSRLASFTNPKCTINSSLCLSFTWA